MRGALLLGLLVTACATPKPQKMRNLPPQERPIPATPEAEPVQKPEPPTK